MSNSDPSKHLTPTITAVNDSDTRHISIIRDDAGYGFTLSRSVIYASDQKVMKKQNKLQILISNSRLIIKNATTLKSSSSVNQFQKIGSQKIIYFFVSYLIIFHNLRNITSE